MMCLSGRKQNRYTNKLTECVGGTMYGAVCVITLSVGTLMEVNLTVFREWLRGVVLAENQGQFQGWGKGALLGWLTACPVHWEKMGEEVLWEWLAKRQMLVLGWKGAMR